MSKKFFIPEPRVFAHRGASGGYPENTLLSFREAVKIGVDAVETDVHFTKDNRFVVAHDGELGRICDGSGLVADYTLADLKKFDAGYGFSVDGGKSFPFRAKGLSLISLEELLEEFPGQRFNIDLKAKNPAQVPYYCKIIEKCAAQHRVLTASEHAANIRPVRERFPEMATSFSLSEALFYYFLFRSGFLYLKKSFPADALQIPEFFGPSRVVSNAFVEQAHKKGLRVHVWTINEEEAMRRLYDTGADAVMSDHPSLLKKVAADYFPVA
ncbi:MAG TPA: glycerophosphodiester phosphodiesterase [Spirochaetota bacterium]|nr:glycerophosphodiester phosphodiesterase [Spirochaetota bacterium]